MKPIRARLAYTIAGFGALLATALVVAPLLGSTPISIARAFDRRIAFADNVDAQIFFVARLPRVLAAALVGGALASSGAVFQALFRNPLASPDTLGVSSGAALGATARQRGLSTTVLLLAGVTMTAFISALIMFTQYLADFTDTFRMSRWLMGMLDVGGYTPIVAAAPLLAAAFGLFATLPRSLDLLSLGADAAAARGVDVLGAERRALVSASLATGAAVSIAGPVGFVGIVVPHLVRLLVGSDHRLVLPASVLFGASFVIGCDLVARTLFSPIEVPVGVITAIIGGPFFLWLLLRSV
jgi:iron complex transport system permease protein